MSDARPICRHADPQDVPWLARTSADVYREVFAPMVPHLDLALFDEESFTRRFAGTLGQIRIAWRARRRLGFSLLTGHNIDVLFVAAAERGSGAGACLLDDAERRGARTLECFAANDAARRFYAGHGWSLAAEYRRDYGGAACDFVRYIRQP